MKEVSDLLAIAIKQEANRLKIKYQTDDPYEICDAMKIQIMKRPMGKNPLSCKGFFMVNSRCKLIMLNSDLPESIQRIILVHELGHAALHESAALSAFHEIALFDNTDRMEYEANIFAGDLFRRYSHYAAFKGWKIEILDSDTTPLGGFSLISFRIKGKGAYAKLKFESGAHRVQRVPVTEANGRIQTSTATVLVRPELEHTTIKINPADLKIDTYHSSGAGGQNVNKTESAVRITHIPTGVVVSCQIERDQLANKETCRIMLQTKLQARHDAEVEAKVGGERRLKVGTGERSERIRTYNYPQSRVTDHRIGWTSLNLPKVRDGDLDDLLVALNEANQKDRLEEETKKLQEEREQKK